MEAEKSSKFVKYLLVLQTTILIGIGICEILQLAEANRSQTQVIQHAKDWNFLFGYTNDILTIIIKIYYWIVLLVSFAVLGWSLESFDRRWKDLQYYNDNPRNIMLLILWCISTIPSTILPSESNKLRLCSESSYTYTVPQTLLLHCNAYLASLVLAYIFIFTVIIQLSFGSVIVKYKKEISAKPPPNLQEPTKKLKVRRSKRVNKKKRKSLTAFSIGRRLSIVTEDEEEKSSRSSKSSKVSKGSKGSKSNKSDKSDKGDKDDDNKSDKNEFNSEMQVNSNV